jgi:rod shape-determining protein MreB and related proteins
LFSNDLSIDLGTANTLIYVRDQGIVLDEPSVVAIRVHNGQKSVGGGLSKPSACWAARPATSPPSAPEGRRHRRLSSPKRCCSILHQQGAPEQLRPPQPRVLVCVPCKSTQVERRAIRERPCLPVRARCVLIEEPMAAAIGAGLPVDEAVGSMVVDIGGGTTEIAIISLNGVVYSDSVRVGGDRFDEAIVAYVRRTYGSLIGEATAERIKQEIGCAYPSSEIREIDVRGRNLAEGYPPRSFTLNSDEILEALQEPLSVIVPRSRALWSSRPLNWRRISPRRGMVLTGGGALLRGWTSCCPRKRRCRSSWPRIR